LETTKALDTDSWSLRSLALSSVKHFQHTKLNISNTLKVNH
jgi:hypothetical protein